MPVSKIHQVFPSDKQHQTSNMVIRIAFFAPLFLLLAPSICHADFATGLNELGWLFLFLIVPIEAFIFRIYSKLKSILSSSNKSLEKASVLEIWTTVLIANLTSSAAGSFFQFYKYRLENLITLGIAFVLSIIIEWLVYIIYFLTQRKKKAFELLNICIIGNVATYLMFFLPQATANVLSPTDYDRLALYSARNVVGAMSEYYAIPSNLETAFDLATLRRYGYKKPEREAFGIKIKFEVEIQAVTDSSNPIIATWHKQGRRVYLIDNNLNIIEKLKTELDDDLKSELGL